MMNKLRVWAIIAWPKRNCDFKVEGKKLKDTRILSLHHREPIAKLKAKGLNKKYKRCEFSCIKLKVDDVIIRS